MTMVEKMARAMCEHDCPPERIESEWAQEAPYYRGFALAALKAIRDDIYEAGSLAGALNLIAAAIAEAETP